ncbi:ankyrin repeat domain-containing protein [bacterium]|nr:ankyrin repeat domain-containing protein [bacterium]
MDLHTAVILGDLEAVNQHIRAGSDLDVREPSRGSTPLMTAALLGKTDAALALIGAGADVNAQNNEGSTALITAAFFCRTEIVRALLENNADKTLKNKAGRTALESVSRPFEDVKGIYDGLGAALAPLGLTLDYEHIQAMRPVIAEMLGEDQP